MRKQLLVFAIAAMLVIVAVLAAKSFLPGPLPPQPAGAEAAPNAETKVINQGEYLARVGDCIACHTVPNGKPFAGFRRAHARGVCLAGWFEPTAEGAALSRARVFSRFRPPGRMAACISSSRRVGKRNTQS